MSFWARSFVFDGIPSETYGLFLISEGGAGVLQNTGSNSVDICSDFGTPQNSQPLFPLFPHLFPMKLWDQMP